VSIGLVGSVARMGKARNDTKYWWGYLFENNHLEDREEDGRWEFKTFKIYLRKMVIKDTILTRLTLDYVNDKI